jgi:hypothetical protein
MHAGLKLEEQTRRIFSLTARDVKPLYGMLAHLTSEVGELAEAIEYHEGHLPHKTMKEPLVGEIADVVQCAMSILARVTPALTNDLRLQLLADNLESKTNKWEGALDEIDRLKSPDAQKQRLRELVARVQSAKPIPVEVVKPIPDPGPVAIAGPVTNAAPKLNLAQALGLKAAPSPATPSWPIVEQLYVNIRKHPKGLPQPTGLRRVYRLVKQQPGLSNGLVWIGLKEGKGWMIDSSQEPPTWLDFRIGSAKSSRVVKLSEAVSFWERNHKTAVA